MIRDGRRDGRRHFGVSSNCNTTAKRLVFVLQTSASYGCLIGTSRPDSVVQRLHAELRYPGGRSRSEALMQPHLDNGLLN